MPARPLSALWIVGAVAFAQVPPPAQTPAQPQAPAQAQAPVQPPAPAPKPALAPKPAPAPPPAPLPGPELASVLPLPRGWKQERLEFPLRFAPMLPYAGTEELRFCPNMFKRGAPDYFSYVIRWWLVGRPVFTAKQFEEDLTGYFQGLMVAQGREKDLTVDPGSTHVAVKPMGPRRFRAFVTTVDAFNGAAPLDLIVDIEVVDPVKGHRAVYMAIAPTMAAWNVRESLMNLLKTARDAKPAPAKGP